MSDMFSKISEILSNPEASRKIREIAASMASGPSSSGVSAEVPGEDPSIPAVASEVSPPSGGGPSLPDLAGILGNGSSGAHSRDLALLNAVRPYLRASRAGKIDNAIKAIRVIDMLSGLR